MYPDGESNWQPFGAQDEAQPLCHSSWTSLIFSKYISYVMLHAGGKYRLLISLFVKLVIDHFLVVLFHWKLECNNVLLFLYLLLAEKVPPINY